MKKSISLLSVMFFVSVVIGQAPMKQYTVGHPFSLSLPDYMMRTTGVNENAAFEYKNEVKDIYGFVIEDNKEEMKLADIQFSSINEFFDEFIKGFIEGEQKVKQSKPIAQKKGDINFIEAEVSYYDKNAKTEIYYLIGIVETKTAFYKVLSYCTLAEKDKYKEDFKKIVYSLKD